MEQPFWESEAYKANPDVYRYGVIKRVGMGGGGWVDWYVPRQLGNSDHKRDLWIKREMIPPMPLRFE